MADINIADANEKSLELLANIAEPYFALLKDPEFTKLYVANIFDAIQYACVHHQAETVAIGAALQGKTVDEFIVNPFTLPLQIATAIGMYSKINKDLFTSADQKKDSANSGSATVNTEAQEQPTGS